MLVLLLFFISGATALIYEVLWSKYLALMFGSTIQAQTVVLAVFMGGLAVGNRLFGRRAAKLKQPLAVYGYVEFAIGLYAFFFHALYTFADGIFVGVGSKFAENPGALLFLKGALALGLLILPTVLMGGTLPLLAEWLERQTSDAGRSSARFYSTNSLGAVFGAGVAGFYLVKGWGMLAGMQLAAFFNLGVAIAAIGISRKLGDLIPREKTAPGEKADLPITASIILVTATGAVSMGLEVLCSRALGLLVGGSLQAFAIVLMAFILGIGTGAGIVASPGFSKRLRQRTVFELLLAAAWVIALFIYFIEEFAILYTAGSNALARNSGGYFLHEVFVAMMAIIALGIPAGLLGAVLPMAIRAGGTSSGSLSDQVGRLLTWNTMGAVAGVLVTGFVLMPMVGLRVSFLVLAALLAIIGALGARRIGEEKLFLVGLLTAGAVVITAAGTGAAERWKHVLGAGLFRMRGAVLTKANISARQKAVQVLYYKDAPDATVSVEVGSNPNEPGQRILRINGKADASTRGDLPTQYLLGHLPIMARPESKDVFILGFGSGITAGAVLGHPIDSLTLAENCAPVLEAAPLFAEWNRGVLTNKLMHLRREDARTVLKLSDKKYDVIISEPSNPWVAGIGSVFTREFYQLCNSRLKDGGVMAQWFHIYEMNDGIVELVIRTFGSIFPYIEIWEPTDGDLILLGSMKPWDSSPDTFQKIFERPQPRRDLEQIGMISPATVLTAQVASQRTAFAIAGDGPMQSDEFPVLEYAAPEAFFIGEPATRLFTFDERSRQSTLAPKIKRRVLQGITTPVLKGLFSKSTANPDLLKYLRWRYLRMPGAGEHPYYELDPALPIIFRPPSSYALNVPEKAPPRLRILAEAEFAILTDSENAKSLLSDVESILAEEAQEPGKFRTWQPASIALFAARYAIANGERERASHFIELGKKFDPTNIELAFLTRLLAGSSGSSALSPSA